MIDVIIVDKGGYKEVSLHIPGERGDRKIGRIYGDTLRTHRKRAFHLMRKEGNAYGINEEVLTQLPDIQEIEIHEDSGKVYRVPKSVYLGEGSHSREIGWDKQVFLPLHIIQKYRI